MTFVGRRRRQRGVVRPFFPFLSEAKWADHAFGCIRVGCDPKPWLHRKVKVMPILGYSEVLLGEPSSTLKILLLELCLGFGGYVRGYRERDLRGICGWFVGETGGGSGANVA